MIRIKVDLARSERDFGVFCAAMNKLLCCKSPHCGATCWARAVLSAQKDCDKGMTVSEAVKKWATTGISHKDGEEIMANILGVEDMPALRKYLSRETE